MIIIIIKKKIKLIYIKIENETRKKDDEEKFKVNESIERQVIILN